MRDQIILGEELKNLILNSDWKAFSELTEAYLEKWKNNLFSYDASKSLEDLGREREKWCLMRRGIEELYRGMNECIELYEESEVKRETLKSTNPHRGESE